MNKCFIKNNQIINNVNKILNLDITFIHGRYDFICPLLNSYILHLYLPKSKLIITNGGHNIFRYKDNLNNILKIINN